MSIQAWKTSAWFQIHEQIQSASLGREQAFRTMVEHAATEQLSPQQDPEQIPTRDAPAEATTSTHSCIVCNTEEPDLTAYLKLAYLTSLWLAFHHRGYCTTHNVSPNLLVSSTWSSTNEMNSLECTVCPAIEQTSTEEQTYSDCITNVNASDCHSVFQEICVLCARQC